MNLLGNLGAGLRRLFRKQAVEREMDEELGAYLDAAGKEDRRAGLNATDAARWARVRMGSVEGVKEGIRTSTWESAIESLWRDVTHGFRVLLRRPGFTAMAILTLGLGIGANSAIFSFIDAWIIQPLPYPQPNRLMAVLGLNTKTGNTWDQVSSTADFIDFQKQNTNFQSTAAWTGWNFNLTGDGPPELVEGGLVSWNFFDTLGVAPAMGRSFLPEEDRPGAGHVAIISSGLWKGRFGSDRKILGRKIFISGEPYTVVGVMPGNFQFPIMGIANLWAPLALSDKAASDRSNSWFSAIGRLKPGVSQRQAGAELTGMMATLQKEFPNTNKNASMVLSPLPYEIGKEEGAEQVLICMWIVALILLIACANVASLTMAQAGRRTREFAVRTAIGATRTRLIRQLLTETLLVFFFGALAGILFGVLGVDWIEGQIPPHVRGYLVNYGRIDLSYVTVAFTLAIALFCGLIFGIAPAFQSSKFDVNGMLKDESGRGPTGTRKAGRLRRIFVVGEVVLAMVVLIATTLLVKSFVVAARSGVGFDPVNVMTAQVTLPPARYKTSAQQRAFADEVLARIRALPHVSGAAATSSLPYGGFGMVVVVDAAAKPVAEPGEQLGTRLCQASPDYFSAMRIPLIEGRVFDANDAAGTLPVAIVNKRLADKLWPGLDPIGQQLKYGDSNSVATVVGVVGGIKMYQVRARPERQMYVPLEQVPSPNLGFAARIDGDMRPIPAAIRAAIWSVDGNQPISGIDSFETLMAIQDAGNRITTKLMGFFGALAAFLCAIGIFGVMAQTVAQRTREIGIRMALGAEPGQVMRSVITQGLKLASIGILLGIAAALATTRGLSTMLYQVAPTDLFTFVSVPAAFAVIAAAACYLPARRAMQVDPMVSLHHE
jgi:putative ABC transport system permease protein